jgi:hypothetical protein
MKRTNATGLRVEPQPRQRQRANQMRLRTTVRKKDNRKVVDIRGRELAVRLVNAAAGLTAPLRTIIEWSGWNLGGSGLKE